MKLLHIILFFFFTLLFTQHAFSQENLTKQEVQKYSAMTKAAVGTYQIQMVDTRTMPAIPLNLIKTIEEKRDENKTIYFYYKPYIRIKILAKQATNVKNFTPLKKIIYISSTDL